MSFKFAYQSVMHHRKRLQELAEKDFAEANTELQNEKKKLSDLYEASTEARRFRFTNETGGASPEVLKSVDLFTKGQVQRIESQKEVVKQHQQIVEKKQEALRKAALSFKIIEKLRDKKKDQYQVEKAKAEVKELDDLVTMRAAHREK